MQVHVSTLLNYNGIFVESKISKVITSIVISTQTHTQTRKITPVSKHIQDKQKSGTFLLARSFHTRVMK